jgi:2-oxoglutarate ferredoxin oxidoreductase subunit alpha
LRDEDTLARPWAIPGTPGLEHRIGGIEKEAVTGNVSYDPRNHEYMTRMRAEKIEKIADDIPPTEIEGKKTGDLLLVGWGSTYGAIKTALEHKLDEGKSVSRIHITHLNPLPKDLGEILKGFKHVLIPEINAGQLVNVIRAKYMVPAIGFNKVQGLPFVSSEIEQKIDQILEKK